MTTVAQALACARAAGLDRLDADLLLLSARGIGADALGTTRSWLAAHDTDDLPNDVCACYRLLVRRRLEGQPLAYITGVKEFYGLALAVDPRVLVPRPDTETLVDWTLELYPDAAEQPRRLLDLGTGSGAIALALKQSRRLWSIDAVDASAAALTVAATNAELLQLQITLLHGRWFEPVTGRYDCIVSNPPYVAETDPHLHALAHEPLDALVSGSDGLRDIRQIIVGAPAHLLTGGHLLLEHGHDQGPAVRALLDTAGFATLPARHDLAGHWRCTGGRWNRASV